MKSHPVAFVFGDSLLIESITTNLLNELAVTVVRLYASSRGVEEWEKAFEPRMIVFELNTPYSSDILALVGEESEIVLIGVDTNSSQVVVLNGSRHQIEDMDQFCQLVKSRIFLKTRIRKGGKKTEEMKTQPLTEMV